MSEASRLTGLSPAEVIASREQYGSNSLGTDGDHKFWHTLLGIIKEPLFVILVGASLVYFFLGSISEGVVMIAALFIVSGIGVYQENKSRNAVDALKKLSAPKAKVLRDGIVSEIDWEDLVVGDLFIAEEGTSVPADGIIADQHDFSVNESILTGESLPANKNGDGDQRVFQGTSVLSGSCTALATAIGRKTELGSISLSMQQIEDVPSPLQVQIKKFVHGMAGIGGLVFVAVWALEYYMSRSVLHGLLQGLTIAMSVLPEEIPVAFSTFMALGAYRLYQKKVIVRNPHTVEALGAATVICADKTGTLTENKMQLSVVYDYSTDIVHDYTKEQLGYTQILEYAMWASETAPFDMMEVSLHKAYGQVAPHDKRSGFSFVHEYPLEGHPPLMTHVFSDRKNEHIIAAKGSVEGILKQCILSDEQRKKVLSITEGFAARGFRVLAVARSVHDIANLPETQFELAFELLGLVGFYDPPKQRTSEIIASFYKAGIEVKMITGDHAGTAVNIATQIGMRHPANALTGDHIMEMSSEALQEKVREINVFARMFPEAKLRIIEALKANGEVVAMTGDGVNDGPALKAAHIGIAMGMRGSDVAKKTAALILSDDDLTHMVDAVALGRRIYENLKKALQYIISIHVPIILIVLMPLVLFWRYAGLFSPVHVIFLELIMGPTCSIIFENEPIEAGSMSAPPRRMSTSFFSISELSISIFQGLAIAFVCLLAGFVLMQRGRSEDEVRTVVYTILIFSNLFLTLCNRSFHYSILTTLRYRNRLMPLILAISLVVLLLSVYYAPVRNLFQFQALSPGMLVVCLIIAGVGVLWVELLKWRRRVSVQSILRP